ncbi:MAG: hypothetical protein FWE67_00860 [Planctomycetaceae bacterium]|nr:hypothetical protein [Planctomycetaceae bacterium]
MTNGIDITIQTLAKSKNKAAARLLDLAVQSSNIEVKKQAGREIMSGKGKRTVSELIRKYTPLDAEITALFKENHDKTVSALRGAVVGNDKQLCRKALQIAENLQLYELISVLLTVYMDQREGTDNAAIETSITTLLGRFTADLDERKNKRTLYGIILPDILNVVDEGVRDYHRKDPPFILYVFLALYKHIPEEKKRHFQRFVFDPASPVYSRIQHLLLTGDDTNLYRFIYYCLEIPKPPPLAVAAYKRRIDAGFLSFIFDEFCKFASSEFVENIKKLENPAWKEGLQEVLPQLPESSQIGLIKLLDNLGLPSSEYQSLLFQVFHFGKPVSRVAVLKSLSKVEGEAVDQFIWRQTESSIPEIQAEALIQLKNRDSPRATARILQFIDSPNVEVQTVVRKLLPEFSISRFFDNYDQMSEEQRRVSAQIVRKIDEKMPEEISAILITGTPVQKAKALLCAEYGGLILLTEDALCDVLMHGESPMLRRKAAELLAHGQREVSRGTLVQAFHRDEDQGVRETAKESLEKRPAAWKTVKE